MRNIKRKGITTIVNLRSFHSDRDEIGATELGYDHIYMKAWHPEREDVVRFLRIVTDPKRTPVLVHCQHGADRTGSMCALYRIAVQGWTKAEAIREMTEGGFGFHEVWQNFPRWITELDIQSIRKDAGINNRTEQQGGGICHPPCGRRTPHPDVSCTSPSLKGVIEMSEESKCPYNHIAGVGGPTATGGRTSYGWSCCTSIPRSPTRWARASTTLMNSRASITRR